MNSAAVTRSLTVLLVLAAGCKEAPKAVPPPPPVALLNPEEATSIQPLLADYEGMRVLLVNDKTDGLASLARTMAARTSTLSHKAPASFRPRFEQLQRRAQGLEKASAQSIQAARLAFGELSREVVGLIATAPSLQSAHRVFECGMAEGYQKWVQPGEELENPYMGQAMLGCGSQTSWDP